MNADLINYTTDNGIEIPEASTSAAERIWDAASEDGYLQAEQMVELFPDRPELHAATSLRRALAAL